MIAPEPRGLAHAAWPRRIRTGLWFAVGLAVVGCLLASAHRLGLGLERARSSSVDPAELTYFPAGPWVRAAALGRARLAADLCWLEAIQYYGKHRRSDQRYGYAETLFKTLTDLDPSFENAYVFGALVLHGDAGAPQAAYDLLDKGIAHNPSSWRLAFEHGFLAYLKSKDSRVAVEYLSRAARLPGAPPWVGRLAAFAATKAGDRDLSLEMWRRVLENSENDEVRRIARARLRELGAPEAATFPADERG
jgi:tetratricopeptide (TPR) repeat protein